MDRGDSMLTAWLIRWGLMETRDTICQCVDFKVATVVHRLVYLAIDCHLVADFFLVSANYALRCIVTPTYSTFCDTAFAAAGPGLFNSLSLHLKMADLSYNRFRRSLKTFLFGQLGRGAVWTFLIALLRNNRTYLLSSPVIAFVLPHRVSACVLVAFSVASQTLQMPHYVRSLSVIFTIANSSWRRSYSRGTSAASAYTTLRSADWLTQDITRQLINPIFMH